MTTIQTKASVFAALEEVTEGVLVSPTLPTDYMAIQEDVNLKPETASLENAELRNSIGKSKPIPGAESPTGSMSHYLKHSGSEAVVPEYGKLLKAWFGSEATRATERSLAAASDKSVLNVGAGQGVEFAKGHFVLIKDSLLPNQIRAIDSVLVDALTPSFQLPVDPTIGSSLGLDVRYAPANSGHISLSLWHFLGNGGASHAIAGARVTEFGFTATAGELINASFSFEGRKYYFNPMEVTAANNSLDFDDGGGEENATIAAGVYTPTTLASLVEAAMQALTVDVITVTYSRTTGKFTIESDGASLSLLWNTGANTGTTIGDLLGFDTAADDAGLINVGDNAIDLSAQQSPVFDDSDPLAAKAHEIMFGNFADYICFSASEIDMKGTNEKTVTGDICEDSGQGDSSITGREIELTIKGLLKQYDDQAAERFNNNDEVRFQYTFGEKVNEDWVAGKCGALYTSSATITSIEINDADGLSEITMVVKAFVNSTGDGETYLGYV